MHPHRLTLFLILLLVGSALIQAQEAPPTVDAAHESRVQAIEMAHAFAAEGYVVRDGFWRTPIAEGEEVICALQLFAGVDYWICLGSGNPEAQLQWAVFSSAARPVPVLERVREPARAALRVRPRRSGTFYVKVRSVRGEAGRVCVTYCYK